MNKISSMTRPNRTRNKYTLIDPRYPYSPGTRRQQASEQAGYTAHDIRNPQSAASITQDLRAKKAGPPVTRRYVPYEYDDRPETRVDHRTQDLRAKKAGPPVTRRYVPYEYDDRPETRVDHRNRVNPPVTLRKPVNQPQPNVPTLPTQVHPDWSINHGSFEWSQNCDSIPATHTHLRDSCNTYFTKRQNLQAKPNR